MVTLTAMMISEWPMSAMNWLYWPPIRLWKLPKVGLYMNFGGMTKASPTGLNAVSTIQKIGSRMNAAPIRSVTTVMTLARRRLETWKPFGRVLVSDSALHGYGRHANDLARRACKS